MTLQQAQGHDDQSRIMRNILFIIVIIVVIITATIMIKNSSKDNFNLPSGNTTKKMITIEDDISTTDSKDDVENKKKILKTMEIFITDGVRHSIPLDEITGGGPPKDGIPSIDNPKFISIKEANQWLNDNEPGIAFSRGNTDRFYPYQIMVWHEIVNDTVGGERILVTYCPLCLTGFVFDPLVGGERVEFGTSGKLWKSNLVMYDRKTDSLWPQILGEAVIGEMTGAKLPVLTSDQALYGNWKKKYPNGKVLSRDTGATRFYGSSPYGDYFSVTNLSLALAKPTDTRLPNEAFIFGIVINEKSKAYLAEAVKEKGEVKDIFEDTTIILRHIKDLDIVRIWKLLPNGQEERINPFSAFWFSWAAAHPETEIYK